MRTPFGGAPRADVVAEGWESYSRRHPGGLTRSQHRMAVEAYFRLLAGRLERTGWCDLPLDLGSVAAVRVTRRPRWDRAAKRYRSADTVDWAATRERGETVRRDGRDTLGFVLAPKDAPGRACAKCLGFVADRGLYSRCKARYDAGTLGFPLPDADDLITYR